MGKVNIEEEKLVPTMVYLMARIDSINVHAASAIIRLAQEISKYISLIRFINAVDIFNLRRFFKKQFRTDVTKILMNAKKGSVPENFSIDDISISKNDIENSQYLIFKCIKG